MKRTNKSGISIVALAIALVMLALVGVFTTLGSNQSAEPASATGTVNFVLVTDESQITEANIGECTFAEAKQWIYDNWDNVFGGFGEEQEFDFFYYVGNSLNCIYISLERYPTKGAFNTDCDDVSEGEIFENIALYRSEYYEIVYLCDPSSVSGGGQGQGGQGGQSSYDSLTVTLSEEYINAAPWDSEPGSAIQLNFPTEYLTMTPAITYNVEDTSNVGAQLNVFDSSASLVILIRKAASADATLEALYNKAEELTVTLNGHELTYQPGGYELDDRDVYNHQYGSQYGGILISFIDYFDNTNDEDTYELQIVISNGSQSQSGGQQSGGQQNFPEGIELYVAGVDILAAGTVTTANDGVESGTATVRYDDENLIVIVILEDFLYSGEGHEGSAIYFKGNEYCNRLAISANGENILACPSNNDAGMIYLATPGANLFLYGSVSGDGALSLNGNYYGIMTANGEKKTSIGAYGNLILRVESNVYAVNMTNDNDSFDVDATAAVTLLGNTKAINGNNLCFRNGGQAWDNPQHDPVTLEADKGYNSEDISSYIKIVTTSNQSSEQGQGGQDTSNGLPVVELLAYDIDPQRTTCLVEGDIAAFQAVTFEEAQAWTGAPEGMSLLLYAVNENKTFRGCIFMNGIYQTSVDEFSQACNTLYDELIDGYNRVFYTRGQGGQSSGQGSVLSLNGVYIVGDTIIVEPSTYAVVDLIGTTVLLDAGEYTVSEPDWDGQKWLFPAQFKVNDDNYYLIISPTSNDAVVGFVCVSGDGTNANPYRFDLVYSENGGQGQGSVLSEGELFIAGVDILQAGGTVNAQTAGVVGTLSGSFEITGYEDDDENYRCIFISAQDVSYEGAGCTVGGITAGILYTGPAYLIFTYHGDNSLVVTGENVYGIYSGNEKARVMIRGNSGNPDQDTFTIRVDGGYGIGGVVGEDKFIVIGGNMTVSGFIGANLSQLDVYNPDGGTVNIIGTEQAVLNKVRSNDLTGTGWTDTAGTQGETSISATEMGSVEVPQYKRLQFTGTTGQGGNQGGQGGQGQGSQQSANKPIALDTTYFFGENIVFSGGEYVYYYVPNDWKYAIQAGTYEVRRPDTYSGGYFFFNEWLTGVSGGTVDVCATFPGTDWNFDSFTGIRCSGGDGSEESPYTFVLITDEPESGDPTPATHTHNDITFTAWESATSLPTEAGSYYLTADVTISSTWNVPSGTTNLCLNGFGIKMTGNDSVIYVGSGKTLNLYDCGDTTHFFNVDSYSTATDINDVSGSHSFDGGYIAGGKGKNSKKFGGGVFIDGTFNLYGGNIIGNTVTASDNCGAGIYCNENSIFRMYGGNISYNYAQNAGCAIFGWKNASIEIHGGEISHNKTNWSSGSAISFWNPNNGYTVSLKLYGGYIHDNLTHGGEGAVNLVTASPTVGLKGNLIVWNNATDSTSSTAALNVYVGSTPINIDGALTNTEKIGIRLSSGTGAFTSGWSTYMGDADPADYFFSENTDYQVYLLDGEAAILAEAPTPAAHTHNNITFTAWESATSLPTEAGNYYLTSDVTISSTWNVPSGTTNLCLNGHGIKMTGSNSVVTVNAGATLKLYDCDTTTEHRYSVSNVQSNGAGLATVNDALTSGYLTFVGGYITGGTGTAVSSWNRGGAFYIEGTVEMYGGTVIGNGQYDVTHGGAFNTQGTGSFKMYGGSIQNNAGKCGGATRLQGSGSCEIYGGKIINNIVSADGGGIHVGGAIPVILQDCEISGNYAGNGPGAGIWMTTTGTVISGRTIITNNLTSSGESNIEIGNSYAIGVGELTEGARIGIKLQSGTGVFTSGWSTYMDGEDPADYFYSDNTEYNVYLSQSEVAILAEAPIAPHAHDEITFIAWESATSLPAEAGNYYLTSDVTISSSWNVPSGTTNLCLNGFGIKMTSGDKSVITVGNGATLNVYDCGQIVHYFDVHSDGYAININETEGSGRNSFVGGYVTGGQGTDLGDDRVLGGGFLVNGGTLHMFGGTVIGNYMARDFVKGAGVWVGYNGTFIMEEGVAIKYNWSDNVGGGVGVGVIFDSNSVGTFIMNGGEISHNKAAAGGGIMLRTGAVTINGGTISHNVVRDSGGAIDFEYQSYSSLSISGAPVINNNVNYNSEPSNVVLRGNTIPTITIPAELTSGANVRVLVGTGFPPTATIGVFTSGWTTNMNGATPADYFSSDNAGCSVYLLDGEAAILAEDPNASAVTLGTGLLYVGGVDIVAAENYTVSGIGGGTAVLSEDEDGNPVLTLTNYVYTGAGHSDGFEGGAIDFRCDYDNGRDLIIVLVGNNTITKADDGGISCSHGIYFASYNHSLIIDGEGTLTIGFDSDRSGCFKSNGIFLEPGTFVMNGGTIVSDGGAGSEESLGIYSNQSIIFNGGSFTGNGHNTYDWHSYGIYCSNITINGGTVYASSPLDNGDDGSSAFQNSTLTINAGTVTAYGKVAFGSTWGIRFGADTTRTILSGENEASATEVNSIDESAKYVRITVQDNSQGGDPTPATHVHNNITFTAWESTNSLPAEAGSYYLTADVTLSSTWTAPTGTTNLCLNGHGIKWAGQVGYYSMIEVHNNNTLNLYDCGNTVHYFDIDEGKTLFAINIDETEGVERLSFTGGYITGGNRSYGAGGAIWVEDATFNMYGGTILGNTAGSGGALYVSESAGVFNMYGGRIMYNNAAGSNGGGVKVNYGPTFTLSGGEILYNYASDYGGGVAIYDSSSTFNLFGGEIYANSAAQSGGGVYIANSYITVGLSGNPIVRDNFANSIKDNFYTCGGKLNITDELTSGASVGVTMSSGTGVFTSGWSTYMDGEDPADYFFSDSSYYVIPKDGEVELRDALQQFRVLDTTYATMLEAYEACGENGVIQLLTDVDISNLGYEVYINLQKDLTIDLNGHTLTFNYTLSSSQIALDKCVLTLENSVPATGGVKGMVSIADDDTYIVIKNCRLIFDKAMLEASSDVNRIAPGFTIEEIDENGFLSLVRPMTKQETIDRVEELIDEIPSPATKDDKDKIDAAREAYDDLPDEDKDDVENRDKLFIAEVEELIDEIPSPATKDDKDKIDAAREAYDDLPDEDKDDVENRDKLFIAEVEELIDEIPSPATKDDKDKIDAAREAYDDLPDDKKEEVENRQDLFDAEASVAKDETKWLIKMKAKSVSSYADAIAGVLADNERVVRIYDVTLWRVNTENDVEQSPVLAQPSDMGNGNTILVKLTVPTSLRGKEFRLLHVHTADDVEFVEYTLSADGNHATINADRLSEFAFIAEKEQETGNVDPSEQGGSNPSNPEGQGEGNTPSGSGEKTIPIEPAPTKQDDPTIDNWTLTPQGQSEQGQGGQGEDNQGQGGQGGQGQSGQGQGEGGQKPQRPAVTVALEDCEPQEGVTVEVEVKTDVSQEIAESDNSVLAGSLQSDDEIAIVYEVKLIRITTEDGVEIREEIQPSDIVPGAVVVINMDIPEMLRGKNFKVMHIHAEDDITEIPASDYSISEDGTVLTVRVTRLSEFAFVGKVLTDGGNEGGNGGAIAAENVSCPGWISLILGLIVFAGFVCMVALVKFRFPYIRKCFCSVGLMTSGAIIIAAVVIVAVHPCVVSAFGFGVCVIDALLFIIYGDGEKKNKVDEVANDKTPEKPIEDEKGLTLKESFSKANVIDDRQAVTTEKKTVGKYLKDKYKDAVIINHRGAKTQTGLPLADTHYVVRQSGKECFVYVYEVDGVVMLLAQLKESYVKKLRKTHKNIYKSAFPKSKKTWYTIIVDNTYTQADVEEILDVSYMHVKG